MTDTMITEYKSRDNPDGLRESKSLANIMGAGTFEYFGQAINASYSMAGNAAIDVFFKED